MNIFDAISYLESQIEYPSIGLPEDIFLFISRLTPMVNVDLLIKDEHGRVLLAWRDDPYSGMGWHIPGGIVRYKETFETRIRKVAEKEIGADVVFDPTPIAINEVFCKQETRGHFISILFQCHLEGSFYPENEGLEEKDVGFLKWHSHCPQNLLKVQDMYRKYFI